MAGHYTLQREIDKRRDHPEWALGFSARRCAFRSTPFILGQGD
jgi:hypothetical protein